MARVLFVEVTDTFSGEANYSWVRRYRVKAKTFIGAIRKVSRDCGYSFRQSQDMGDCARYDVQGACVCAFVSEWYESHDELSVKDL